MNPLIADVLEAKARQDVEIASLEQTFEEDCECEAKHNYTPYCSGDVIYRITSCANDYKACKSTVDDPTTGTRVRMDTPKMKCIHCLNLASECWTIRPI